MASMKDTVFLRIHLLPLSLALDFLQTINAFWDQACNVLVGVTSQHTFVFSNIVCCEFMSNMHLTQKKLHHLRNKKQFICRRNSIIFWFIFSIFNKESRKNTWKIPWWNQSKLQANEIIAFFMLNPITCHEKGQSYTSYGKGTIKILLLKNHLIHLLWI